MESVKFEGDNYGKVSFEKGLSLTGIGKYNYIVFFITIFSLLAAAADMFGVGILVASAQCDLDLDTHKKGLITSVPMLGVIVSAHLWGYLADTRGRKYTLTITMLGTTIAAILSSFAHHWIVLAVMKFFSAACASGTNAVIYAFIGEVTPEAIRPKYLLYSATTTMLSLFVNSLIAYPVLSMTFKFNIPMLGSYRPWRLLAKLFGMLSFFNFLMLHFFAIESPKYYFAKGDHDSGLEILRQIFIRNNGALAEPYPVKKVVLEERIVSSSKENVFKSMWNRTVPLFQRDNIKNTFLVSYIAIIAYSLVPAFVVWLPSIFSFYSKDIHTNKSFCEILHKDRIDTKNISSSAVIQHQECDDSLSGFTILALMSFSLYMTVLTTVSVVLIKYTGKQWMFIGVHILSICLCLTINLVHNIGGMVMFIAIMTAGLGTGIVSTYAVELFPTYLRAMAISITMMIGRAFSFISINLIGPQLEKNCHNFMYIIAAFLTSGIIVASFLPKDKQPIKRQEIKEKDRKESDTFIGIGSKQ